MGEIRYNRARDVICASSDRHVLEDNRAVLHTGAAAGAAILDDAAGFFADFYLEISGGTFHAFQVRIGDQFNV
jgi:hypothetical protein